MPRSFVFDQPAYRVIFGVGSLDRLADEVARLGATRALVVSTRAELPFAEDAARRLGPLASGIFADAVMHHPIEIVRAARARALEVNADCYVTIGGGTTTGTGKAIALETGMPVVAVPTTYAGSEMTPIYGITDGGVKKTGRDRRVLPRTVIYDPALTVSLPPQVSGPSGINAMAHCVEGLYAFDGNPITTLMAAEGIRALARALPRVVQEPGNLDARADALYGAWLAGIVLGSTSMGIHHKLCHTLGGTFNLPHADVHTVILPHATAYNRDAAPEAMRTRRRRARGRRCGAGHLRFDCLDWRPHGAEGHRHARRRTRARGAAGHGEPVPQPAADRLRADAGAARARLSRPPADT